VTSRHPALTSATVDANVGSGDVRLVFTSAPADVDVKSGSGDVRLVVPGSEQYAVAVDTGSGDSVVGVNTAA
jgi:hypothetical protein